MLSDGRVVALDAAARKGIQTKIDAMAAQALRCIAFARKEELGDLADYNGEQHPAHKQLLDPANYEAVETGLTWLGVAGLQDPPRPEVAGAIAACAQAGIRVSR